MTYIIWMICLYPHSIYLSTSCDISVYIIAYICLHHSICPYLWCIHINPCVYTHIWCIHIIPYVYTHIRYIYLHDSIHTSTSIDLYIPTFELSTSFHISTPTLYICVYIISYICLHHWICVHIQCVHIIPYVWIGLNFSRWVYSQLQIGGTASRDYF